MTLPAEPANHDQPPLVPIRWVREAIVKTLTGLVLGLITAFVLVGLSAIAFPELQEVGQDLGLRLGVHLKRLETILTGHLLDEDDPERTSFLFVDVDPEHGLVALPNGADASQREMASGSQQACIALATAFPDRYRLAIDRPPRKTGDAGNAAKTPTPINCSSSRPLNRYLLAELIKGLAARGARIIVLDVVLAGEHGIIDEQENEALKQALRERALSNRQIPILYADPVEAASPSQGTRDEFVRLDSFNTFTIGPAALVRSAVALPSPGQPVRRYPKCLFFTSGEGKRVPTLPFLAAEMLRNPRQPQDSSCPTATSGGLAHAATNAPRIVYTLPPLEGHQDDTLSPARTRWAVYQRINNRCLAASFWDESSGSACAGKGIYDGKVVVVGASNPVRRDRHYTPLGDMAGAEVVINAIRSFTLYPSNRDKSTLEVLCKDVGIVFACAVVWFGYFLIGQAVQASRIRRALQRVLMSLTFLLAVTTACMFAVILSFDIHAPVPSLNILLPVLAIGVDVYTECARKVVHRTEKCLRRLLRMLDVWAHH